MDRTRIIRRKLNAPYVTWREELLHAGARGGTPTPGAPSYADVRVARAMLETLKLPTEIVLAILDQAAYWPGLDFTMTLPYRAWAPGFRLPAATVCLYACVLDENMLQQFHGEKVKIREIEFNFTSRDQGWTSDETAVGTFNTTSWLEVSILRQQDLSAPDVSDMKSFQDALESPTDLHGKIQDRGWKLVDHPSRGDERYPFDTYAWYLQGNRVTAPSTAYKVIWSTMDGRSEGNEGAGNGEGFLDQLEKGDSILVWLRAQYIGWKCKADSFTMSVRYGF